MILTCIFSQIVQLSDLWQSSDALGGPGRWAYAGVYKTNEAAQQAVVEAYKRQYVFNSACGRATDASNTYHYAFFACDYLPDVVGKDVSFNPSVDTTAARVGTVKLVRKDFMRRRVFRYLLLHFIGVESVKFDGKLVFGKCLD